MSRYLPALIIGTAAPFLACTAHSEPIQWGGYTVSRHGTTVTFQHAVFGTWDGLAAVNRPAPTPPTKHTLQFEFQSPDYFDPDNRGHFAVAVTADQGPDHLIGRGITIGNVSQYGIHPSGCVQSPSPNRVTIESFWEGGNCVWGDVSSSPQLENNRRYRLTLQVSESTAAEPGRIVEYRLEQRIQNLYWRQIHESILFDPSPVPTEYAGWFLLEVFSEHDWTMNFYNVTETLE